MTLDEVQNSIIKRLESIKGNWPSDYKRNTHIEECIAEVDKVFIELKGDSYE